MRVLHVNSELGFSGGEVQVMLLLRGLRERGIDNVLCAAEQSEIARRARAEGFRVNPLALRSDTDLAGVVKLRKILRAEQADVVHLHSGRAIWLGSLAGRSAGVPVVATKRMERRVKHNLKSRFIWCHAVDAAVGISRRVVEQLHDGGVPPARCHLVYSTVDPGSASGADDPGLRIRHAIPEQSALLLALGSLHHRKGFDVLIEAAGQLRDRHGLKLWLAIGGDGPERDALAGLIEMRGLSAVVHLMGQLANVGSWLSAADVLVMPSRAEGLGIAALEAMAAGCPIVASRVGGLAESIVDGETGLLVQSEDPTALADALARLLKDAGLQARMRAAGPVCVRERFSPAVMVDQYVTIYRTLTGAE